MHIEPKFRISSSLDHRTLAYQEELGKTGVYAFAIPQADFGYILWINTLFGNGIDQIGFYNGSPRLVAEVTNQGPRTLLSSYKFHFMNRNLLSFPECVKVLVYTRPLEYGYQKRLERNHIEFFSLEGQICPPKWFDYWLREDGLQKGEPYGVQRH